MGKSTYYLPDELKTALTRDERDFRPITPLQGGVFRLLPKDL
jgi:hypothetical protein